MKHGFEDRVAQALAGVEQYVPATLSLAINGKTETQPEIVKGFQDILELFKDLHDLRNAAREQLKRIHSELVPGYARYVAVERALQAYFGKGSPTLTQFGYKLGIQKPRTGVTNVQAQAKAQLTRALRHTMGRRQKAAIQADAPSSVTVDQEGNVLPKESTQGTAT